MAFMIRNLLAGGLVLASAAFGQELTLRVLGSYSSGIVGAGGSEVVAYDAGTKRAFVVNAGGPSVDVLDLATPSAPRRLFFIGIPEGYAPNGVAVKNGIAAVCMQAPNPQENGIVAFYDVDGNYLNQVTVGALPDMVAFTPDGKRVLTANEGEPNADYTVDPEGSVSIIRLDRPVAQLSQADVSTARFTEFNTQRLDASIRVFGPRATPAQDFEPEYITVSPDSRTAYVTLQENNAIAVIDVETARVTRLFGLGFKDHSLYRNSLDASDRDNAIRLNVWPVRGMYLPDAIASYANERGLFLLTANEGDAREYTAFDEQRRGADLRLDPGAFPNGDALKQAGNLGRLRVTGTKGDIDGDGDYDELYSFGDRSFTVWNAATGAQVFDSGNDFEVLQQQARPELFNVSNNNNTVDDRSDDKGPEPEGIVVGRVGTRDIGFVCNERDSSIVMYSLADPAHPILVGRGDNRLAAGSPANNTAGDLGPETMAFIPAADSPNGRPLLLLANEISGTLTVFQVEER